MLGHIPYKLYEDLDIDFSYLKNNPLLVCFAKIIGECSDEIKKIDKKEGFRLGHDPKSDKFYDLKRQYIRFLYQSKHRLFEKLISYEQRIEISCTKIDSFYLDRDENENSLCSDEKAEQIDAAIKELERLQKIKLIGAKIVEYIEELINANYMCVFDLEENAPI